ncbi:hypothetical protein BMAPRL20_1471 [Burkholderia mallei PRL-20]|nr:hypothetical protein BMA721280_I0722 [Burkholderia mallei 2002721280]EES43077.1 hypothetical protein BMAPRL20_1471 [Burkholderia mallei PRL-20]
MCAAPALGRPSSRRSGMLRRAEPAAERACSPTRYEREQA